MSNNENVFDLISRLKSSGVSGSSIASHINSFIEFEARENFTPYLGQFELTPFCNLNCKMCYVHLNQQQTKNNNLLDTKTWKNLMSQAIDAGMVKARLSGGECLMYPNFDELYLYLKSKGIFVSVLTNGLLLNSKRIEFFKTNMPEKIQISLYGSSEEAYENVTGKKVFSTIINNIKEAQKAKLPIIIAITPSKYLENDLKNVLDLVKELEVEYTINSCLIEPRAETNRHQIQHDISVDSYIDFYKYEYRLKYGSDPIPVEHITEIDDTDDYENKGIKCGAGRSKFTIDWKGIMHPCNLMESISSFPLVDGVEYSWKQIVAECTNLPQFTRCNKCPYSKMCSFCFGVNEQLGSRYELNDFWCERTKKRLKNGLIKV